MPCVPVVCAISLSFTISAGKRRNGFWGYLSDLLNPHGCSDNT
jgi:hypothetical protein